MTNKILLITALRSINHHKGRSLLTMLGIIIGIASIIAIMAIGRGAEEKIKQEILAEGDNYIVIYPGSWLAYEKGKVIKKKIKYLSKELVKTLQQSVKHIKKISAGGFSNENIYARGNAISAEVKSGNKDFLAIIGRTIARGQFFNQTHEEKGSRVVVIGFQTAQELFKNADPIGQTIQIKKINFTIIGVVQKIKHAPRWGNPDRDVFIPTRTAQKLGLAPVGNRAHVIILSITKLKHMPHAVKQIRNVLRMQHQINYGEPDDFTIIDQASMLKAAKASSNILTILLFIIAAIALLVGGIGVMNIMLVSVKERTQEIGIRMAIGARGRLIAQQFLLEAIILCCLGGTIGIGIGCIAPFVISMFTGWTVIISLASILVAVAAIIAVGVIFGLYPAQKASQLDPVLALTEQ